MILLGIIVILTVALLIAQPIRIEVIAVLLIAALGLSGLLTPAEALSGFSNTATLTIAAMLVLSAGLERAGVVDFIGAALARRAHGGVTVVLLLMAIPTVLLSAFMNNTVIVALMIPVALTVGRTTHLSASRLLLPVSYLSILAGTCTLIGTSTNILVDSLYREAGGPGFSMFEFSGLGLVYLLVGGAYVILFVPRMLPHRTALAELMGENVPGQFVTEVSIPTESWLVGRALSEAFGEDKEVRVLELIRNEDVVFAPLSETLMEPGDVLLIEGTARAIHEMIQQRRVMQGTAVSDSERVTINLVDLRMVEAVVTPTSGFLYRPVQDLKLSRRLGIQVLAVRRLGRHHQYNLRRLRLQSGDVLLLQGQPEALRGLEEAGEVMLIAGIEQTLTFPRKAPLAIGILAYVVALATLKIAPLDLLAFAGVGAMLLTGCLTFQHATRALEPAVLLLLAAMIPLGVAMEKTGLALEISAGVVRFGGSFGPFFLIASFYLLTSILTEVLSNNASAVLLTPIALAVAAATGIDPKPLLVAVTFGASASFATPVGYQTNTMVMGPGGYLVRDYLRVGVPLNVIMFIVAAILIPVFWSP